MKKTGIFYGSSTGNTEFVAHKIQMELGIENTDIIDVAGLDHLPVSKYNNLIFGTSTWGLGDLQDDFDTFLPKIEEADLTGKTIAFFGLGDQNIYEMSFINGMGLLYKITKDKGCKIVGEWPIDGYFHEKSSAMVNNKFVGLAIDEENQSELTDERVKKWVELIKNDII